MKGRGRSSLGEGGKTKKARVMGEGHGAPGSNEGWSGGEAGQWIEKGKGSQAWELWGDQAVMGVGEVGRPKSSWSSGKDREGAGV